MYLDVVDLGEFYATPVGLMVAAHLGAALARISPPVAGEVCLGFGYATPYLEPFLPVAERVMAFMPAPQGVTAWPEDQPSRVALVDEDALPLPDACVDRCLLVHSLEHAGSPGAVMQEACRVLRPRGKLVVAVPNRQGPWARSENSPFGFGRPFSRGQLRSLLREGGFEPREWDSALHMSPWHRPRTGRTGAAFERLGRRFWPALAGVVLTAATKEHRHVAPAGGSRRAVPALASPTWRPAAAPA